MKVRIVVWSVRTMMALCLGLAGCSSEFLAGAGAGAVGGHALTKTIEGAKADLERREQQLVDAYNKGVEMGAEKETLDEIAKEIEYIRLGKKAVAEGEGLLTVDWDDPQDIGTKLGGLAALVVAYLSRKKLMVTSKKLTAHKAGEEKFKAANPNIATMLYNAVGEERAKVL